MAATSGGSVIVVAGNEPGDGFRQLLTECGAIGGRAESDLAVDRQRRPALAGFLRGAKEPAQFANDPGRQREETACGEPDGPADRVGGPRAHGAWGYDVRRRRR